MCASLGRVHEFLLALKKAGLNDFMIQRVINSKSNHLAQIMVDAYQREAENDSFELVSELSIQGLNIKESEMLSIVRSSFYQNEFFFDNRLRSFQGENILLDKRMEVLFFRPKEPVSYCDAKKFIEKKGDYPGFYALCAVWFSERLKKEKRIPPDYQLFSFVKKNTLCPVLTRFSTGVWHFSVCQNNDKNILGEKSLIMVLKK